MKLSKNLSGKQFFISQFLILIFSLAFLFGLYYILNIQYQKSSSPFADGPVTSLPKIIRLDLDNPDGDSLTFSSEILISGKTSPLTEVLISTEFEDLVIKSKPDGTFSTTLNLEEGVNTITAAVFDQRGDSKSVQRVLYYSEEKI